MDIIKILQMSEFRSFYDLSLKIYKPVGKFKYHSAIALNFYNDQIYSVKFYFATFEPVDNTSILLPFFNESDLKYLYSVWDINNLDNKGLSYCIKYYPNKNQFKYQIHCKTQQINTFNNLQFSDNNCRYGLGIENGETKRYINVKSTPDKILLAKHFNHDDLVFFDELEYCEANDSAKVITSICKSRKILTSFLARKITSKNVLNIITDFSKQSNLELLNIGLYKDLNLTSYYFYALDDIDAFKRFKDEPTSKD